MQTNPVKMTPDLSKASRRERGLSQKNVIEATGIPSYKLKQWEGRGLSIELADTRKLSDFYESLGINLAELSQHLEQTERAPVSKPEGGKVASSASSAYEPRPGFFISSDLPGVVVDKLQTDMEESDDRIAEFIKTGLRKGLFGDLSRETEAMVQELFAHLAMNYLRFRCLQGRNVIEPTRDEAKTVGDYLAQWVHGQGVIIGVDAQNEHGNDAKSLDAKAGDSRHVPVEQE